MMPRSRLISKRVARKRDELTRRGYDAARESGSASEAFRVEFAHTTTALEGNGLTLAETAMVLLSGILPSLASRCTTIWR